MKLFTIAAVCGNAYSFSQTSLPTKKRPSLARKPPLSSAIGGMLDGPLASSSSRLPDLVSSLRGGAVHVAAVQPADFACALVGVVGASLWLKIWTSLASAGKIDPKLSRKIVHSGSAPLFLLTWPFFSDSLASRAVAALVPLVFMARLVLARRGRQPELVKAISRTGDSAEATGGPFTYCAVLIALTLSGGLRSAAGVVAVMQMAVGDGLADIVGRRVGKTKWPWSDGSKSVEGSLAFALGAFVSSLAMVQWFALLGTPLAGLEAFQGCFLGLVWRLGVISVACAAVELLPIGDDNLNVPVTGALLTHFLTSGL
eukprot:CAMPEP_0172591382 /NCGR_PEP_ID=MMETSP1068-20121228/10140_1 /TAXON_ID=35684 /ORGANISM="Pseudopedinella elastica, Strain CCMP716" /LENGTH=313 /DNA_ID=CAMNT_0013387801 /DNA_START=1120 /DNA_END=2061 /DNA_ORIENTATION=-